MRRSADRQDLDALAARARDVIFRYGIWPRRRLEYINDAVERIMGYTPEELYADPDPAHRLIHPDDVHLLDERLALGPPPEQILLRMRCKDGRTIWMEHRETAIRDHEGNLIAIEGIARVRPDPTEGGDAMIRVLGGVRIDLADQAVHVDGNTVHLTPSEFRLLSLLTEAPGSLVPRHVLMQRLWQSPHSADAHACETHVSKLRQKIERDPRFPERIRTVRGMGYVYVPI